MSYEYEFDNFISFGDELIKNLSNDETAQRTVVSRWYYGIYHKCLDFLNSIDINPDTRGKGSHQAVWDEFDKIEKEHPELSCLRKIAEYGRRMHEFRKKADYEKNILNTHSVNESKKLQEKISELIASKEKIEAI